MSAKFAALGWPTLAALVLVASSACASDKLIPVPEKVCAELLLGRVHASELRLESETPEDFIQRVFPTLFRAELLEHAFANVLLGRGANSKPEVVNGIEAMLSPMMTPAQKAELLNEIIAWITKFIGANATPEELIKSGIAERAELVGMSVPQFNRFARLWMGAVEADIELLKVTIYLGVREQQADFAEGAAEALPAKSWWWGTRQPLLERIRPMRDGRPAKIETDADLEQAFARLKSDTGINPAPYYQRLITDSAIEGTAETITSRFERIIGRMFMRRNNRMDLRPTELVDVVEAIRLELLKSILSPEQIVHLRGLIEKEFRQKYMEWTLHWGAEKGKSFQHAVAQVFDRTWTKSLPALPEPQQIPETRTPE